MRSNTRHFNTYRFSLSPLSNPLTKFIGWVQRMIAASSAFFHSVHFSAHLSRESSLSAATLKQLQDELAWYRSYHGEQTKQEVKCMSKQLNLLESANHSLSTRLSAYSQVFRHAFSVLTEVNKGLSKSTSRQAFMSVSCESIVLHPNYAAVWVGLLSTDDKDISSVEVYTANKNKLDLRKTVCDENILWIVTHSGKPCIRQHDKTEPHVGCNYMASISLPLFGVGNVILGVLVVYSDEVNAFNETDVTLLTCVTEEMAAGLNSLRWLNKCEASFAQMLANSTQLEDNIKKTVTALSQMTELRDPYTSGHQTSVSLIAVGIATKMGLPPDTINSIKLASQLHDIGKISIPAEILVKPGKISEIEYQLIQTHAQSGYNILDGIGFNGHVAEAVLQHHERFDGSGYPGKLKGDEILMEARIIGVADTVEAMSSHRPYRPGFGLDFALAEIKKQRGVHFDPSVVDACIELFKSDEAPTMLVR